MDVIKARAFLCAVKNKSLKKAAEEFNYTPSAFSHMADSLEEQLGVKLIVRSYNGIELTENGKLLCEKLENLVAAEDQLIELSKTLAKKSEEQLKIGTYSSISLHLLPPIIKAFKQEHPEVEVSIGVEDSLIKWRREKKYDVVIADTYAFSDCEFFNVKDDAYLAIVPTNLFEGKRSVTVEELYPHAYIATNETQINSYVDKSKFKEVLKFSSVDDATVLSMVKEGLGVAVLPSLTLTKKPQGVKALKIVPSFYRTLGLAVNSPAPDAAKSFVNFLIKKKFIKEN